MQVIVTGASGFLGHNVLLRSPKSWRITALYHRTAGLDAFVAHHHLQVDAALGSGAFGRTKPHPTIFREVLARLEVEARDAAMVGDSIEDDVEGAHAAGIERAFLLDREDRHPNIAERLPDLLALPAALGLSSRGAD